MILLMTFDSKLTFEKHLRSVSRAASQRLGILRKSLRVFHESTVEYCSAVWCSAADTHLKLLDREIKGTRFLTEGMFECYITHRRSVAVLWMLYKIRCNLKHPHNGAVPGPYAPVRATPGALVVFRYSYEPPRCRTSQYSRTLIYFPLSVPLERSYWPCTRWCVTGGFQEQGQCLFIDRSCSISTMVFNYFSISILSVYRLVLLLWGWGLRTDGMYITHSQPSTADLF